MTRVRHKQPVGVGLGLRAPLAADLVDLDPNLPFLEFSPENIIGRGGRSQQRFSELANRYPLLSHGLSLNLGGTDPLDDRFLEEVRELVEQYQIPWHSDHLCFCSHHGVALHDLLPLPFSTATADRIAARVRHCAERLGVPMAVENISYYVHLGRNELSEPEFIARIVEQADCLLLLDVNNVAINARNFGFSPHAWLEQIPLHRVVQLHVAGGEYSPEHDAVIDTHGADTSDEVVALMQWVVERTGPLPVLLERDNNIPPLAQLLEQVATLQAAYDQAVQRHTDSVATTREDASQ